MYDFQLFQFMKHTIYFIWAATVKGSDETHIFFSHLVLSHPTVINNQFKIFQKFSVSVGFGCGYKTKKSFVAIQKVEPSLHYENFQINPLKWLSKYMLM